MASISTSLDEEKEKNLHSFFSRPVRLHLLYKSSHHGANLPTLLSRFDLSGKFVLAVFLESGEIRGGFTSHSLQNGGKFSDDEAFVFDITTRTGKCHPKGPARAVEVHLSDSAQTLFGQTSFSFGQPTSSYAQTSYEVHRQQPFAAVSFGKCLFIYSDAQAMHVNFCADSTYGCRWSEQNSARCVDVELHRVEVGSGKSSLINSIRSTMYRRVIHLPNVGTTTGSYTTKLKTYDIRADKGASSTALSLCDVMAVGDEDFAGISLSDTLTCVKGHIPEGYQFQSDFPITDKVNGYKATPTLMDRVHCVLFVLDASKVASSSISLQSTLRKLHTTISDLGVPQLILLTHVDQVCCTVREDLKHVYSSRAVQEKIQRAAELVGLPVSYVLPVQNYVSQLSVEPNTDILLLSAVNSILQAVDDTLEDQSSCRPHTPTQAELNILFASGLM